MTKLNPIQTGAQGASAPTRAPAILGKKNDRPKAVIFFLDYFTLCVK